MYDKALPLFNKILSHLVYTFFWLTLLFFLPPLIITPFIFLHLFLLGCRLTTLLLIGGLKPIILPPLPIRLTTQLHKNPSLSLLEKHNLQTHPGLLTNLALIQLAQKHPSASNTLSLALNADPQNPTLLALKANTFEKSTL